MSGATSNRENEIKLRVASRSALRRRLQELGFRLARRRVLEVNVVFDTPDGRFRRGARLLRLRRAGSRLTMTFKGPPLAAARHKSREELEVSIGDLDVMTQILARLGLEPVFRYEKYRTEYTAPDGGGLAVLDETPVGDFCELEGPPRWIDRTARALGYAPPDYITASYGTLYLDYCREHRVTPAHMLFQGRRQRQ